MTWIAPVVHLIFVVVIMWTGIELANTSIASIYADRIGKLKVKTLSTGIIT